MMFVTRLMKFENPRVRNKIHFKRRLMQCFHTIQNHVFQIQSRVFMS